MPRRIVDDDDEEEEDDDVVCVGKRTREERDVELRKHAVDVDDEDIVEGIDAVFHGMPNELRAAAVRWCKDHQADRLVHVVEAKLVDAFVESLRLVPGGVRDALVRTRLTSLLQQPAVVDAACCTCLCVAQNDHSPPLRPTHPGRRRSRAEGPARRGRDDAEASHPRTACRIPRQAAFVCDAE